MSLLCTALPVNAERGAEPLRSAAEAYAEGRPIDPAAADAPRDLKDLVEQAAAVQQGRDPSDPPELFAAAIGVVSDKFKLDVPAKRKALDLYLGRIRAAGGKQSPAQLALLNQAADKYLREPGLKPEVAARVTRRMDAYAKALGGLADDGSAGVAAAGPARALDAAELAALSKIPRARVTSDMTRIRDVAAPEIAASEPSLALRGVADLQLAETVADDGAVGTWLAKKGIMLGGVGKVIGGKLSEPKTYSDWWQDLGTVARGFTPSTGFVAVREGPGAAYLGGMELVLGVAHDFQAVYDQGKAYVGAPTVWNGLEMTASIGMVGINAVGLGAPGAAKTALVVEAKTVAKAAAKEAVKEAAERAALNAGKEAAEAVARDIAKAETAAAAKAAIAATLRQPKTVQARLIKEYSEKFGVPADAVEKALAEHVKERGFDLKIFDSLSVSQQETQIGLQLNHPDFFKQKSLADALQPKVVGVNREASASASAAFSRSSTYANLVVVDGGTFQSRLYRHIGGEELARALAERGLAPKGSKGAGVDFARILNEANGAEGLVKNRVLDNPAAKSVLYEFTEHAERSGLGAGVSTAGPIKIEILPRPGQKFISTNGYAQELLGHSERGWATMDAIAIEQINIFGAGCPTGCRLSSVEGMALAKTLIAR